MLWALITLLLILALPFYFVLGYIIGVKEMLRASTWAIQSVPRTPEANLITMRLLNSFGNLIHYKNVFKKAAVHSIPFLNLAFSAFSHAQCSLKPNLSKDTIKS